MYRNMKNATNSRRHRTLLALTLLLTTFVQGAGALSLRTVDTHDGLSSMFVLSLYQDDTGYVWAGTYNGVSILEGNNSAVMPLRGGLFASLNGNVIQGIQGGRHGQLWFHSNFGLAHWDETRLEMHRFPDINGNYKFAVSPNDEVIVVSQERGLQYYNTASRQFSTLSFKNLKYPDILAMTIDANHHWFVASRQQVYETEIVTAPDGTCTFRPIRQFDYDGGRITWASIRGEDVFYIDDTGLLCLGNVHRFKPQRLFSVAQLMQRRGSIKAIVRYGDDIVIGFTTDGAVRMHKGAEGGSGEWQEAGLDVKSGVFDLMCDRRQNILWVATDGEGIKYFADEPYDLRTETFQQLPYVISTPVRAIQKDRNGDLWIATKGDGLLCYPGYDPKTGASGEVQHLTTANSALLHNSVYCLTEGPNGIVWMGSDGRGINYYIPSQRKIGVLDVGSHNVLNVHGLCAVGDELWVAAWGQSIFRIRLRWEGDRPVADDIRQLLYEPGHWELAQFLAAQPDGDYVWGASRENGVARIDRRTLKTQALHFDEPRLSTVNDVVSLNTAAPEGILFATSAGLLLQPRDLKRPSICLNDQLGIPRQPVRSIIYTPNGHIWFCTPHELIQCNAQTSNSNRYGIGGDIKVSEFVEGATFYDRDLGVKYFGGTGGVVVVSPLHERPTDFTPDVTFHDIVFSTGDMQTRPIVGTGPIEIAYNQNYYSVKYDAIDYLHANNYAFEYRLGNNDWVDNGRARSISFVNQPAGNYTLQVRYRKGNYLSPAYELRIRVLPPWWQAWYMRMLYLLATLALVAYGIYRYIRKQQRRQQYTIERMNERHREEVYESKLRFFTNITHEFSTPLTLISGPCQRILDTPGASPAVKDYATLIQHSSTRLNNLIQQLIEFRRIDTGNRTMRITETEVTKCLCDTAVSFNLEAEKNHITYKVSAQPGLTWPTDTNAFNTICINLISNAFKYVEANGTIIVRLAITENDRLRFIVSNSGRGISQEQIDRMFNRYAILEVLEDETSARGFARNGLGLAITEGLVKGLDGNIHVQGEEHLTTFTVTLPRLEVNADSAPAAGYVAPQHIEEPLPHDLPATPQFDASRSTILVVDDNQEMTWFLVDLLQKEYNVLPYTDPQAALEAFRRERIDLVVSDIIMEPFDGIELCRRIKEDSLTRHIPVILLSSRQNEDTQVATAEAGAEAFMSKPFDLNYLRSVIQNLLKRNRTLKDYFNSSISAYDLVDGKRLHHEDKELIDRMTRIINDNLANPDLSTQFVAQEMGIGLRNIYRKMATFTELTPKDMIREARLERARQLLTQTGMSMEEVCYQAGFGNRGTFYKLFAAKFGCTPKQYHDEQTSRAKETLKKKG